MTPTLAEQIEAAQWAADGIMQTPQSLLALRVAVASLQELREYRLREEANTTALLTAAEEGELMALRHWALRTKSQEARFCELQKRDALTATAQAQESPAGSAQWKLGDEYLPYHPSASHADPNYRDGWNDCFKAARDRLSALERELAEARGIAQANIARAEAAEKARADALSKAVKALEDQYVDAKATGEESDWAYNCAVRDCVQAIQALAAERKETEG